MMVRYDRNYYLHFLLQTMVAVIFMFFVLFSLDHVGATTLIWAAGASSLASSCFIVFGAPHIESAKPYRIVLGYLITIVCGHLIRMLADAGCAGFFTVLCNNPIYQTHIIELAAVISMCLAFVFMALLRCAHPPAAGLSIVMVLDIRNYKPMVVIFVAAVLLALIRRLFDKRLTRLV